MIRAKTLSNLHAKRTLQAIYAHHQATPYSCYIDTAAITTETVLPGMVASKTTGEQMKICDANDVPFGLFANFINGELDEVGDSNEISVWRGGPDATFEISGDALDATVTWTALNDDAGGVLLYSNASGKLTNVDAGSQKAVARLIEAQSNSKILVVLVLAN